MALTIMSNEESKNFYYWKGYKEELLLTMENNKNDDRFPNKEKMANFTTFNG